MSSTGSVSVSGLLGGTAGQIDTTALIANLMTAAAVPQRQLQDQLTGIKSIQSALQAANTKMTSLLTAAQALTDPAAWTSTSATSSSTAVVASSDGTAAAGSFTFNVTALAKAQITTVPADANGYVVSDPEQGLTLKDPNGVLHTIPLAGGTPDDVATAINDADLGVRALVVQTTNGKVVQVVSQKTGTANAFDISGFSTTPQTIVAAADAKITVGSPDGSTGYAVTSSTNTFTGLYPGVTVTAGALANDVRVDVTTDTSSISTKVNALITAANAAHAELTADTAKGAVLQGRYEMYGLRSSITGAVAQGTSTGGTFAKFGIDTDMDGNLTFDAAKFAQAYASDPAGTKAAIADTLAGRFATTATDATAGGSGTITQALTESSARSDTLNKQIDNWTARLGRIQSDLQTKYGAMETALSKLQGQQSYLKSMFASMDSSSGSSS